MDFSVFKDELNKLRTQVQQVDPFEVLNTNPCEQDLLCRSREGALSYFVHNQFNKEGFLLLAHNSTGTHQFRFLYSHPNSSAESRFLLNAFMTSPELMMVWVSEKGNKSNSNRLVLCVPKYFDSDAEALATAVANPPTPDTTTSFMISPTQEPDLLDNVKVHLVTGTMANMVKSSTATASATSNNPSPSSSVLVSTPSQQVLTSKQPAHEITQWLQNLGSEGRYLKYDEAFRREYGELADILADDDVDAILAAVGVSARGDILKIKKAIELLKQKN
eukprot:c9615_g1_i1.p1 GENE.c9615_g1_i1~~c9615_g1_i1.p1  ORF type:complete len:288 (+),score=63.42 c9615_g1_i1:37-864(+)